MTRIIIFAKAPAAGISKTRLAPALGFAGAARLAKGMLQTTLDAALSALQDSVELRVAPDFTHTHWQDVQLPERVQVTPQGGGDLGARLHRAATAGLEQNSAILLIGTDCPELTAERLRLAAQLLRTRDAVIQPAADGGYVLLGLTRCDAALFADMPWSTSEVFLETCRRMTALAWHFTVLDTLHDIDEPADLRHLPADLLEQASHE